MWCDEGITADKLLLFLALTYNIDLFYKPDIELYCFTYTTVSAPFPSSVMSHNDLSYTIVIIMRSMILERKLISTSQKPTYYTSSFALTSNDIHESTESRNTHVNF